MNRARGNGSIRWTSSLLALAAALATASAAQEPPSGKKAVIGALVPEHEFRPFLAGGDGRQKLSEFRGQPVLIVNWTDSDFGRGAAGEVEDLAKELVPEGLIVILRDTHNKSAQEIEAAVMRLYPGSPARLMQNQELPIEYLDNGPPPDVALVGVDGTLLVAGSYTADMNKAAKLVKSELKRRKTGWGEHEAARAARALLHGRGALATAKGAIDAALQAEPDVAELGAVQAEVTASFEARARSVRWLLEHGEPLRAQAEALALAGSVKGVAEWETRAAALLQELESAEVRAELELDGQLAKLLQPLARKGPDREPEKLRKFAAEAGATRVGKRALHVAEIAALAARR